MTFADLTAGDAVFVDANTFIYQFAPDPAWPVTTLTSTGCRD
jgi:hypothetical protein